MEPNKDTLFWHNAPDYYQNAVRIYNKAYEVRLATRSPKSIKTCWDAAIESLVNSNRLCSVESVLAVGRFVRRFGK